jgi:hypothetical protein
MDSTIFTQIKRITICLLIFSVSGCSTKLEEDIAIIRGGTCTQCTQACKDPFLRDWTLETTSWNCTVGNPFIDPNFCFYITNPGSNCGMVMHQFFCCDDGNSNFNYELELVTCNEFDISMSTENCNGTDAGQNWEFSGNGVLNDQGNTDATDDILHINFNLTYPGGGTTFVCGADFTPIDKCDCKAF